MIWCGCFLATRATLVQSGPHALLNAKTAARTPAYPVGESVGPFTLERGMTLSIRDWATTFERHETRRVDSLRWVCLPVGRESEGFRRLMRTPEGVTAYGVFCALIKLASRPTDHTKRGILADDRGDFTPERIEANLGIPLPIVKQSLQILCSQEIAWLIDSNPHPIRTSADEMRAGADEVRGVAHLIRTNPDYIREQEIREETNASHSLAATRKIASQPTAPEAAQKRAKAQPDQIRWDSSQGWLGIAQSDRESWGQAYPACNLETQLAQMSAWLRANTAKAKKSNWRKFIVNWLSRSQDRGGDTKSNPINHADARRDAKAATEYPEKSRIHLVRKLNAPIPPTN